MAKRHPDRPTFASERELCEAFLAGSARPDGWTVYPETDGWDVLLLRDGVQVGIQAKLRPTLEVLAQACRPLLEWRRDVRGPHYIAVLVPWAESNFRDVAQAAGLLVIHPHGRVFRSRRFDGEGEMLLEWGPVSRLIEGRAPLHFEAPAWVPPVVPDVPAGVPSPVQLTEWKVRALRFLARMEIRGFVTIQDLREFGMTGSLWYNRWLVQTEGAYPGPPRWVRKPDVKLVDQQHPGVFAAFVEEARQRGLSEPRPSKAEQARLDLA